MATDVQEPPVTQAEREATAGFDPSLNSDGRPAGEVEQEKVRSMADIEAAQRAQAAANAAMQQGEEDDGQFFVFEQGRKVTLGSLIGRNVPVTYEVKLTGKVLKGPGSLIAFSEPDVTLVVPSRGGKVEVDPVYDQDGSVKEVHVRQNIKARTFYDARTEAARAALDGE